jgi:hypothetical protein
MEAGKIDPSEAVKQKVYSSVKLETKHPALQKKIKDYLFRNNNLEKLRIKAQENEDEEIQELLTLRNLENITSIKSLKHVILKSSRL